MRVITTKDKGFSLIELLIVLIILIIILAVGWYIYKKHNNSTNISHVGLVSGSFKIVGNQIIEPNGKQFIPYGFVLECPVKEYVPNDINSICTGDNKIYQNPGSLVIQEASKYWKTNIVRLQVAQELLFSGANNAVNQTYLNLVDGLVKNANNAGMVATITLQEEVGGKGNYAFPTATSTAFWRYMSNHYKNNPEVFFDLYNEPQLTAAAFGPNGTQDQVWSLWQNGGTALEEHTAKGHVPVPNSSIKYVGMQSLVNTIRAQGANNIVIAESNGGDKDLSGLPTHHLSGANIAYGIEPNLKGDNTQAEQNARFGQYTKTYPIMPEAFLDTYSDASCFPASPYYLPLLLDYLKSLHMGLIFWTMAPGIAIIGNNINNPTTYPINPTATTKISCNVGASDLISNKVGYGQDIQNYYKANSIQL